MKDQLLGYARRYWADFRGFSAGQKAVTVVAIAAVLIGGFLFSTWKSTPTYAPLYTNLAASDASAIVDKLNSAGVPYRLAGAGTQILVPQDKVYSTRLTVSSAGLPSSSQTGYALLDKEGITTSDFKQQVDYQRAIEGELANTIQAMSGVQSASVHLAIPQQDVFNDGSAKTTAAVMLSLASGTQLTTQQVQSIVYLVSSAVPGLSSDSVTVADSNGQLLATPGGGVTGTVGASTQQQQVQDYDNRLATQLQALLTPVLGLGHAVVTVNADLNFDKTNTTKQTYVSTPNTPPLSAQNSNETYTGNQAKAGTLGAGTPATSTTTGNGGSYSKTNSVVDNALGTITQTIQSAPGNLNSQSISVLLDSSVKTANVGQITQLLSTAAHVNSARGDAISVQAMPFDNSAAKAAAESQAAAAKAAAKRSSQAKLASMVKQGALAAILIAVLVGTWLASRKRRHATPVPSVPYDDFFGFDGTESEPEPMPVAPAVIPGAAELREAAARRRALVALAEEQPGDVASVLSGWLGGPELVNSNGPRNPWGHR